MRGVLLPQIPEPPVPNLLSGLYRFSFGVKVAKLVIPEDKNQGRYDPCPLTFS